MTTVKADMMFIVMDYLNQAGLGPLQGNPETAAAWKVGKQFKSLTHYSTLWRCLAPVSQRGQNSETEVWSFNSMGAFVMRVNNLVVPNLRVGTQDRKQRKHIVFILFIF